VTLSRPVILIVDDDPAVRSSLQFALELDGYEVRLRSNASEVLDGEDFSDVACLVIDVRLPGMSGLDLLAELRRRSVTIPAVLITSDPPLMVRERARREGVPIVEKPLLGNALSEGIRHAVAGLRQP
jgi:FixJ family two-component response regulator